MLQESYIGVKLQDVNGKGLLSSTTQGSSCATTEADPKSEREESKPKKVESKNFIVKESKKQYTRSKYVNSLRVGVRIVLPSGRCNCFYEVCFWKIYYLENSEK